jgi:hypothetical protein
MQPAYLPWLGYFHRISLSDLFIVLDHVQIDKSSKTGFAHRNKVRTKDGWTWLTIPLKTKGQHGNLLLDQIEIDNEQGWARKHWMTIRTSYGKAPFFREHGPAFEALFARPWPRLIDISRETLEYQLKAFGIGTPVRFSSDMQVPGANDELIVNLCRAAGATAYISGPFGRDYLSAGAFEEAGIELVFHDYHHPEYPQLYQPFEKYMAAIDLLFNRGPQSMDVIREGNSAIEEQLSACRSLTERPTS